MLNKVSWAKTLRAGGPQHAAAPDEPLIDLFEVFRLLRRQRALIAGVLAMAILGGLAYLAVAPSYYTASSMLLFDVRKNEPFQQQGYANETADSAYVDSQVEVLKSDEVARSVVKRLNLQSDPEFVAAPGVVSTAFKTIKSIFGLGRATTEADVMARAARKLQANLTIKRTGLTYVVSIDYRSLDPNKAARISNAVTDAYFVGQLDSKYRAAQRANAWLQDRIKELKLLAETTERAVADYKSKSSSIDNDGRQLNEQELAELSSQRRVLLKDLESSAQTYRALHQTLLQRVTEFTQQQSFPTADARVVSEAMPPLERSEPKSLLILAASTLLGLVGGLGAGFLREYLDNTLRTPSQVQTLLGVECLGILPTIIPGGARDDANPLLRWITKRRNSADGIHDSADTIDGDDQDAPDRPHRNAHASAADNAAETDRERFRYVVDQPFSRFAETIRSLQIAAELAGQDGHKKVLGVTSSLPREGKSLVAANLSKMLAFSGSKVLLIDCQPRNRGLTHQLAPKAHAGLMSAIVHNGAVEDLIWRDPNTPLDFLPMDPPMSVSQPLGVLSAAMMENALASVQERYDYIILDLPAITPVADVKAVANLVDHFILVIAWGYTSQNAVRDALDTSPLVVEKLLGAVLNNADPAALKKLDI